MIKKFEEFLNESTLKVDSRLQKGAMIRDHNGEENRILDWIVFSKDIKKNLEFVEKYEDSTSVEEWVMMINAISPDDYDLSQDLEDPALWKDALGHLFVAIETTDMYRAKMVMPYIAKGREGIWGDYGVSFDF